MKDKDKERIKKFIELQNKDLKFEDIALELGIAKTSLFCSSANLAVIKDPLFSLASIINTP